MAIKLIFGKPHPAYFSVPGTLPIRGPYEVPPEGEEFKAKREARRLSEREAAKRTQLSVAELVELELGERVPEDPADWQVLLRALDTE